MNFLNPSLDASLNDLKAIHWILIEHHADELEGNGFFESLHTLLLEQARVEGVDVGSEQAFNDWLASDSNDGVPPPRELMN